MAILESALGALENSGTEVDMVSSLPDLLEAANDHRVLRFHNTNRLDLDPGELGELVLDRDSAIAAIESFFTSYDILLIPAAPVPAFQHDQSDLGSRTLMVNGETIPYFQTDNWSALAQYADLPVTTAPVGFTDSGLPVGVQVIAATGGPFDPALLPTSGRCRRWVCRARMKTPLRHRN